MIDNPDFSTSTVRLLVWQALKLYSTDSLVPMLEDEDSVVRTAVASELQLRGERTAFDQVLHRCDDPRDFVREIAAFTLGQFGTPNYPFRLESIPKLCEMADRDVSVDVRASAVAALGHLHARESLKVLLEAARDAEVDVRAMAAVSLGRLGSIPNVVEALQSLLSDPSGEVREWAEFGIGLIQDDSRPDEISS